ncbi:hypothetical protein SAMN05216474_2066 [Lishizhenia tianjinensis]|uniref:Outer membrane protein beta-barrel domain-containing protein n=1 Tax=Lishizhenia tianjinensis TaxID=477690 RepID=A0A1I7AGJ5_9FLAO|nr:hypothetical protein [Lishizhenia tianjinensis]SFT74005.1 hypothetical protein SAMN05216474_2066 [Lishizhenia tianjinensis]
MKNKATLLLSLLLISPLNFSQEREQEIIVKDYYPNAVYGSLGIGGLYFTATGFYERTLSYNGRLRTFAKVGVGGYALWGIGGVYGMGHLGLLTGANNNHLELSAGYNRFFTGDLQGDYPLSGTMGYRFQKPDGLFIFRTGVSFPEAVYLGLGFSF